METPNQPLGDGQVAPTPAPQGQAAPAAPQGTGIQPASAPSTPVTPNLEGVPEDWQWDGNPNNLPQQFRNHGKGIQRYFTKRSMAEAELRRKGQEYEQHLSSDDYKAYQEWKKNQGGSQSANVSSQPANASAISQQEWEEAQLDPTGQKAQSLIDRVVQARLNEAVQMYGGQLQQLQQQQQVTQFQTALSDYADANPDVVELHEMGLMKPLMDEEFASGKHRTYEAVISSAHQRAAKIREAAEARALQASQQRVVEKQGAVVNPGVATGDMTVVTIGQNENSIDAAFEHAAQNKKVKVRKQR